MDWERYAKQQQLKDYRNGFKQDYDHKLQLKYLEELKRQQDREEYLRLCSGKHYLNHLSIWSHISINLCILVSVTLTYEISENARREIKNEEDYKQKFVNFDAKTSKYQEKFSETVLKDQSQRRRHKEAITDQKPSYIDKLNEEQERYFQDKQGKLKSAYRFQKDRIDSKYRQLNQTSLNKTKMGEQSYEEFRRFKEDEERQKQEARARQSDYANALKYQVHIKENRNTINDEDVKNDTYLGKYKLHKNSSLPMIPGINSVTSFAGKGWQTNQARLRHHRLSHERLPSTLDMASPDLTRNKLLAYKNSIPDLKQSSKA